MPVESGEWLSGGRASLSFTERPPSDPAFGMASAVGAPCPRALCPPREAEGFVDRVLLGRGKLVVRTPLAADEWRDTGGCWGGRGDVGTWGRRGEAARVKRISRSGRWGLKSHRPYVETRLPRRRLAWVFNISSGGIPRALGPAAPVLSFLSW